MASPEPSSSSSMLQLFIQLAFVIFVPCVFGCYTSIFNFGDSLSDTGNLYYTCSSPDPSQVCFFPYGETFFHRPTGRFSDGRVTPDFFGLISSPIPRFLCFVLFPEIWVLSDFGVFAAISLGLPLLKPYRSDGEGISAEDFVNGLNFAVGGATALDVSFFRECGIHNLPTTAISLRSQLQWFKQAYSSFCASSTLMCRDVLKNSLFIMGEIGGNDYNYFFFDQRNIEEIKSFVPSVVKEIASVIMELIELGVETLMVPANIPIGCLPVYLQLYETSNQDQYDPQNSCLKWLNRFSEYHNEHLQEELKRIRALYPHVRLIYADYFKAALRVFNAPKDFGFIDSREVCCVDGNGSYYFPVPCGLPSTIVCDEPSKYVSWDGIHLTEAAYKVIATNLLQGSFTTPQFSISCLPQNSSTTLLQLQ